MPQKQFTLSEPDFKRLSQVVLSCGLTHSQVISQYIKRYSRDLEQLLGTSEDLEQLETTSNNLEQLRTTESFSSPIEVPPKAVEVVSSCSKVEPVSTAPTQMSAFDRCVNFDYD